MSSLKHLIKIIESKDIQNFINFHVILPAIEKSTSNQKGHAYDHEQTQLYDLNQ